MPDYRRPALATPVFRDAGGAIIPYGERWPDRQPDPTTYSQCAHPERFAPLVVVARALVEHLGTEYAVIVGPDRSALLHRAPVVEATRLVPVEPDAPPLTVAVTSPPGVVLTAGVLFEEPFPSCSCDACDDDVTVVAEELERRVFSIVAGGLTETIGRGRRPWTTTTVVDAGGLSVGRRSRAEGSARQLRAARARLAGLPGGWQPWTRR